MLLNLVIFLIGFAIGFAIVYPIAKGLFKRRQDGVDYNDSDNWGV